jgi:hypothetical protein
MTLKEIYSKKKIDDLDCKVEELEHRSKQQRGEEETDRQREARFSKLREARRVDREKHPENYPPTQYWWRGKDNTMHCYYFPRDWYPTDEEVEFYRKIASDYDKGIIYRFHSYDMFLAYNHFLLDELSRWDDWVKLGHIHDRNETLEQWKAHGLEEHHLHKEPPPYPPLYWETLGDLIRMQADHTRDITNSSNIKRRRKKDR